MPLPDLAQKKKSLGVGEHAPAPVRFIGPNESAVSAPAAGSTSPSTNPVVQPASGPHILVGDSASATAPKEGRVIYTETPQMRAQKAQANAQASPRDKLRRRAENAQINANQSLSQLRQDDIYGTAPHPQVGANRY